MAIKERAPGVERLRIALMNSDVEMAAAKIAGIAKRLNCQVIGFN
jgi:hypothetical protein